MPGGRPCPEGCTCGRHQFKRPLEERFWEKVDKRGPLNFDGTCCWLWTAACSEHGYGVFTTGTWRNPRHSLAHCVAYELLKGSYEGRLDHRHTCPKNCVNPDHLRPVSHKQNLENLAGAHRDSLTGVRGVTWDKVNKKYRVQVKHNDRPYHGGRFSTLEEAEQAAIALRNRLFTHNDADREIVA